MTRKRKQSKFVTELLERASKLSRKELDEILRKGQQKKAARSDHHAV